MKKFKCDTCNKNNPCILQLNEVPEIDPTLCPFGSKGDAKWIWVEENDTNNQIDVLRGKIDVLTDIIIKLHNI